MKLRKALKISLIAIFVLTIIFVLAFFFKEFISNYYVRLNLDTINAPGKNSRLLIFSPHNDDEVLAASDLIKQTFKNGGQVKVVFITNGDGFKDAAEMNYLRLNLKPSDYIKFGYLRQKESIAALKSLGLPENNIIFLGYPDGGISYFLNANWDKPYTSEYTQTSKSPYSNSYTNEAPYTGQSLVSDISNIIKDYQPTHIVYPHPNDRHPDHWATNVFIKYTLTAINYMPQKEWLYLVHRGDWPTPMKQELQMYLVPPYKLTDTGTLWYALDMDDSDINTKTTAINLYKSQHKILAPLMDAFERKNELFGEYPNLKVPQSDTPDSKIRPNINNLVIEDPLQDALDLQISHEADISRLYAEESKNNNLNVFLETDAKIESLITYRINLVFFNNDKISRLTLDIKGNKLTTENSSKQSITDITSVKSKTEGNMIHIIIPYKITGDFKHIYINASSWVNNSMLDRTAWRMLDK